MSGAEALVDGLRADYVLPSGCADCVAVRIGLVRIDFGHPVNPGDVLRFNPDDIDGWHFDRTAPRRRVRPLRRVRPAPRDPLRRRPATIVGLHRLHAERAHLHGERAASPTSRTSSSSTTSSNEGPTVLGCVAFAPNGDCLPPNGRADDRRRRRRSSATSATTGSSAAPATTRSGAAGATTCSRPTTICTGCLASTPNGTCTQTGTPGSTTARHAPDVRGPRVRRRRPRRADRQHRRRPADRLDRRVQQLHRPVRAVRDRDRQPPGAAGAVRVPLRALGGAGRRPDARRRHGTSTSRAATASRTARSALITQQDHGCGRTRPARPPIRRPATSRAASATCCARANFERRHADRLRARQRRLGGLRRRADRLGGLARHGRGGRLRTSTRRCRSTTRSLRAVMVIKPTAGWKANALPHLRLLLADRLQVRRASTSRRTRSFWATARRRAGSSTCQTSVPGNIIADRYYDLQVVVDGLVVTVLVNGTAQLTYQFAPRWIDGQAVRPQHGPRRRRLRQLARCVRQLRRADAAAAVDVRRAPRTSPTASPTSSRATSPEPGLVNGGRYDGAPVGRHRRRRA